MNIKIKSQKQEKDDNSISQNKLPNVGGLHRNPKTKLFKYISFVTIMEKDSKSILGIFLRYLILVVVAFPSLWIFYFIFTPLTVYPVYFLLNLFFDASLISKTVILIASGVPIEIIGACVAGSAYYFLLILNLTTGKIRTKTRIYMILFSFLVFLIVNILRIFFLSLLAISDSLFFDITHILFWYLLSIVFVVGIWFTQVKIFKIKEIPIYSDIKFLYKKSKMNFRKTTSN